MIGNIGPNRQKLYILFRKAGSRYFDSGVLLQDGYSEEWGTGYQWTYPCACEDAGKLYIMYTVVLNPDNARGAMLSVLDLKETAED